MVEFEAKSLEEYEKALDIEIKKSNEYEESKPDLDSFKNPKCCFYCGREINLETNKYSLKYNRVSASGTPLGDLVIICDICNSKI